MEYCLNAFSCYGDPEKDFGIACFDDCEFYDVQNRSGTYLFLFYDCDARTAGGTYLLIVIKKSCQHSN